MGLLSLPFHWRNEELFFPGNFAKVGDGPSFALLDDSTRCGFFQCGAATAQYWTLLRPCTREVFFDELVPQAIVNIEAISERSRRNY